MTAVERDGRFLIDERPVDELPTCGCSRPRRRRRSSCAPPLTGAFGERPDIVLSGINRGPNTGHAVLHSGTVGAALTASTFGLPALAMSLDVPRDSPARAVGDGRRRGPGRAGLAARRSDEPLVLNVNAPNCPLDELRGVRRTRLATFGAVQTVVTEHGSGYVKLAYDEVDADLEPGTDAAALADCTASVTSLHAVCEEVEADVPDQFELGAS